MEQNIESEISDLITQAEQRKSELIAWLRTQPSMSKAFVDRIASQKVSGRFCPTLRAIISDLEELAKAEG